MIVTVFYSDIPPLQSFRHTWHLRKRKRPQVPCPTQTPMPDQQKSAEGAKQLYKMKKLKKQLRNNIRIQTPNKRNYQTSIKIN